MKKIARFCAQAVLSVVAFGIIILALIQIVLIIGINLFNTGKAHDFIQAQVNAATKGSGYDITFDQLFYDPVRGFTLYGLDVADAGGQIATLDRFSLAIAFSKIPLKQLDIAANAGTLNLVRLPASTEEPEAETEEAPLAPFTLPDIYFRSVRITAFTIEHLQTGEAVAGTPLSFSPSLKAAAVLSGETALDLLLLPKPATPYAGISLPEKIALRGTFDPQALKFALDTFEISSPDYAVKGTGQGTLTESGTMTLDIGAAYPDLKPLTQNNVESAQMTIAVDGPYAHPALNIDGTIVTANLKERGLSDIALNVTADDILTALKGNVAIKTAYRDQPVTLDAALHYETPSLIIESLRGTAPFMTLTGKGVLQGSLFDGSLALQASDLSHYKDLLGITLAGAVKADADFKTVDGVQALDIAATLDKGAYDAIRIGKADINASLADIASPWPQKADAKISGLILSDTMSVQNAAATITQAEGGVYKLALNGNGKLPAPLSFKGGADLSNLTDPVPTANNIGLTATLDKSSVTLSGSFDPAAVDLKITTKDFRGDDIPAALPDALSGLRLSGDVTMTGNPAAPVTKADITATGIETGAYKGLSVNANAAHADGKADITISGKGTGIRTLNADASLPLTFALYPFAFDMNPDAALAGKLLADLDLGPIASLFLPPTQDFAGSLSANGTIGGTVNAPDVNGTLALQNGNFNDEANGITLSAIKADAAFTKDSVMLNSLTATDGEAGTMSGRGAVSFGSRSATSLTLGMKNFHLPKSDLANGHLDADFALKDAPAGYAATGQIVIAEMNVIVPETFQSKIPELNIVERKKARETDSPAKTISLAVKINAPNQVFVRGWGLDAEFGGTLDITGDASAPQFNGALSSRRGRYEEFGKRFTLARADLRFQGAIPPSPYLDIEATTPADDVTASVLLTGSVKAPSIAFSSTPALPEDEVLSRILFGRSSDKITPFQAVQLAQTLRRFSGQGGGGLDPLGMLRSATGLDDISVDTDESGQTNVGVGKYLTDNVYLEVEKGKAADSGAANIQIELTPSINIESEIGQDAQGGGGIFWKRDY